MNFKKIHAMNEGDAGIGIEKYVKDKDGITMGSKSWVRRMLLGLKSLCIMHPTRQSS